MTLEQTLVESLKQVRCQLATVESCTGGLLAHRITGVAGASEVFWGGMVTYDNSAKELLARVPRELLVRHGAVSREVAMAMAEGGFQAMTDAITGKADGAPGVAGASARICVATTGVAGPGGGSPEKPVGLCFIGIAATGKPTFVHELRARLGQSREENQREFAQTTLELLVRQLPSENP